MTQVILKPCPFCGTPASNRTSFSHNICIEIISCADSECLASFKSVDVATWNRRLGVADLAQHYGGINDELVHAWYDLENAVNALLASRPLDMSKAANTLKMAETRYRKLFLACATQGRAPLTSDD